MDNVLDNKKKWVAPRIEKVLIQLNFRFITRKKRSSDI